MSDLTPTEELVMEVLSARRRLGENLWTFPSALKSTLRRLEDKGYIGWKGGIVENTLLAWLDHRPDSPAAPWCQDVIEYRRIDGNDGDSVETMKARAFSYLPKEIRRLAMGAETIEDKELVPQGWSLVVQGMWLNAVTGHGDVAIQIRPSDIHDGWYGTYRHPFDNLSDHRTVDGSNAAETFNRALMCYQHTAPGSTPS